MAQAAGINSSQVASLRIFEGKESEDIETFIANVDQCRTAFGWDQVQTVEIVQLRLQGVAAQWIRAVKLANKLPWAWTAHTEAQAQAVDAARHETAGLLEMMRTRFRVTDNVVTAADAIMHLKQEATESSDSFYCRSINCDYHVTLIEFVLL